MTRSLAIVCEARADRETACGLADRVLCAEVDWIDEETLDDYRQWRGFLGVDPHLLWKQVHHLAREKGIRAHGHFGGEPGALDAKAGRLALLLLRGSPDPPDAVMLVRDDDRQTERRRGLDQARDYARERLQALGPVVIGLAHPKRGCWVLAGFDPRDDGERSRVEVLRQELGFHPGHEAERLTAIHDHDLKSARRVLGELTGHDPERRAACRAVTALGVLEARGRRTGLADYLGEVRGLLVPLFR